MPSNDAAASNTTDNAGAFAPFRHRAFALLWVATLVSNIGTWMHEVGAGWLMTTLAPSPAVVALVQAATTLPIFCFALLAGALADRLDKRRLLIGINIVLMLIVATLALLVRGEAMTPVLLIAFTFAIGTGAAFMAPAWQAVVPQLVPRELLRPAIGLNSMGINISRAIGPALAGVLIASIGLASPFAVNAVSHLAIIVALLMWRPEATPKKRRGPILVDIATGLRHVANNAPMKATLARAAAFFIFASAYWALLPLIARGAEKGGAELYGILLTLIGAGAVCGALLLPRLQKKIDSNQVALAGTAGTALALVLLAMSRGSVPMMVAAFVGGVSWIAVLTSLNVSAQTALPDWVRARGLSVFLTVFFGSMALGSVVWGQVASRLSISTALLIAAAGLALGYLITRGFRVGQGEDLDLTPANAWPAAPPLTGSFCEDRPAMVSVEYNVAEDQREAFAKAMRGWSQQRYRDGARHWSLQHCIEEPDLWLETFHLPSWAEHLEQHERLTKEDADLQQDVRAFDTRPDGPVVRHYLKPLD